MITIDPRMMSFAAWSAKMVRLLSPYGNVPDLRGEASWQEWGESIVSLSQIAALLPAHPHGVADWRSWAHELNRSLEILVQ